jgi:tRNA (guanine-N7-)-methyltransferase
LIQPALVSTFDGDRSLSDFPAPLPLDTLVPGTGEWEVEIGFGKGRYLLRRSLEDPGRRFLGIEVVGEYQRLFVDRARRRGARNWAALRGDALFLMASVLPAGFAAAVHVYFPDPWPKSRHHKRRLFDPQTVDLVLGLLAEGGRLYFATDFLEYGELVTDLLESCPGLAVQRRDAVWDEGPRTNYEAKYMVEGRPIRRLEVALRGTPALHPRGAAGVLAAPARSEEPRAETPGEADILPVGATPP